MTREEAIKTLHELWRETNDPWYEEVYDMAIEALKARPKGEWIESDTGWKCSECNYGVKPWNNTNFCPNCGADMRGDTE